MVTEETLKTHEMELESRIRNLVWTVSGDYTLKLNRADDDRVETQSAPKRRKGAA